MRRICSGVLIVVAAHTVAAQIDEDLVRVRAPRIALTHVRLIDGTGAPAVDDRTIVIEDGKITALGSSDSTPAPENARVLDLHGHTVIPGLIGMHNHLFYAVPPGDPFEYVSATRTFPRLYLASGITTLRTAGTFDLKADADVRRRIDAGDEPGPALHLTSTYFHRTASGPPDVNSINASIAKQIATGATSFKAYTSLRRDELSALIAGAHRRGMKVTGHLCAVSFREAAELGIDSIDHGLWTDAGIFAARTPDRCPDFSALAHIMAGLDLQSEQVAQIIQSLVTRGVGIVSTLAILESLAARSEAVDVRMRVVLAPLVRERWEHTSIGYAERRAGLAMWERVLKQEMAFERAFVAAGGLLMAGADPTGWGCGVAGFMDQRNIELLVEAGFTPEQAIRIYSVNAAAFLGQSGRIGALAIGKQADLVVIRGDPSKRIADIRNVTIVFRNGVGFDSAKLIESVAEKVGLAEHTNPILQMLANTGMHPIFVQIVFFGGAALALVIVLTRIQSRMARAKRARRQM
jgi:imidazolonepropionase-like amidohydrolase